MIHSSTTTPQSHPLLKIHSTKQPSRMKTVRRVWLTHFVMGLFVLCFGIFHNGGGRKYISVQNPALLPCTSKKAYVNVYSTSIQEKDAIICCSDDTITKKNISHELWFPNFRNYFTYNRFLCSPLSKSLPFARRIIQFPDSWILPLIPLFMRIVLDLYRFLFIPSFVSSTTTSCPSYHPSKHLKWRLRTSIQRLIFFHLLMQFRGWGLYLCLDRLEDYVLDSWRKFKVDTFVGKERVHEITDYHSSPSTLTLSTTTTTMNPSANIEVTDCWYSYLLDPPKSFTALNSLPTNHDRMADSSSSTSSSCQGRDFDFSDHIVFYYVHVLPILLFEVLFCLLFPFWQSFEDHTAGHDHKRKGMIENLQPTQISVMMEKTIDRKVEKQEKDPIIKDCIVDTTTNTIATTTASAVHTTSSSCAPTSIGNSIVETSTLATSTATVIHASPNVSVAMKISTHDDNLSKTNKKTFFYTIQPHFHFFTFHVLLPTLLLTTFIYMNILAFLAVVTTAAVHHTVSEIIVGYLISLVVQIPLGILMCSDRWTALRSFLGLVSHSGKTSLRDKKREE